MLYDPKWEQKTEVRTLTLAHFIAWLETKPTDEIYSWAAPKSCALGQYYASMGRKYICEIDDIAKEMGIHPLTLFDIVISDIGAEAHTFGAALERARERLTTG